jgi:hypothetical protein
VCIESQEEVGFYTTAYMLMEFIWAHAYLRMTGGGLSGRDNELVRVWIVRSWGHLDLDSGLLSVWRCIVRDGVMNTNQPNSENISRELFSDALPCEVFYITCQYFQESFIPNVSLSIVLDIG